MVLAMVIAYSARVGDDASDSHIRHWLEREQPGDVNEVDEEGNTALSLNIQAGGGWESEDVDDRLRIVKFLLAKGANVDICNDSGASPLFHACNADESTEFGLPAVRCLLDAGANIDARTTRASVANTAGPEMILGETPLSTSLDWFRYEIEGHTVNGLAYVSLLLSRGASLDDCWGSAPAEACLRHPAASNFPFCV